MAGWLGYVPGIEGHGGVVGVCTWHGGPWRGSWGMYLALRAMAGWLGYVPSIEGHGGVVGVRT